MQTETVTENEEPQTKLPISNEEQNLVMSPKELQTFMDIYTSIGGQNKIKKPISEKKRKQLVEAREAKRRKKEKKKEISSEISSEIDDISQKKEAPAQPIIISKPIEVTSSSPEKEDTVGNWGVGLTKTLSDFGKVAIIVGASVILKKFVPVKKRKEFDSVFVDNE
jgi:hypothetical protein